MDEYMEKSCVIMMVRHRDCIIVIVIVIIRKWQLQTRCECCVRLLLGWGLVNHSPHADLVEEQKIWAVLSLLDLLLLECASSSFSARKVILKRQHIMHQNRERESTLKRRRGEKRETTSCYGTIVSGPRRENICMYDLLFLCAP